MIDEKKLIDDIKLLINRSSLGEITSQTQISVGEIATLINEQPQISEWIPCMENMEENEEKINECISFLERNGYIVKKWTKRMDKDADECVELDAKGQSKDCCGCACSVCLMQ